MRKIFFFVAFLMSPIAVSVLYGVDTPKKTHPLTVSIERLPVNKGERVVGFEFHVISGRIAALPNVPMGWNVTVDNDPTWKTSIRGSIAVGAAAVDASFFHGFMLVEKDESLGLPFDVMGDVVVSHDFEHERHIQIGMKDLTIKAYTVAH